MPQPLYHESLRPQFHFSAKKNWINDPNGLVFFDGEYHLFFQHNPEGINWGPNWWGHAVGTDLVHWEQLDHAIAPDDRMGWIWSGSAAVDAKNTSGLGTNPAGPIITCYTQGDTREESPHPCVQCIAFSNDRGRTFTKFDGNPVLGHIRACNRDPKIIWHEPTGRWIMALFLDGHDYALFASPDLKTWEHLHDLAMPGVGECPDFFELPIDGDPQQTRWVFWGANGGYRLGSFDGRTFTPDTDVLHAEFGANGYAAQTWSDVPPEDGRRIQISWLNGGSYPEMPFNQQMSFPVVLTLRTCWDGVRLCRWPVHEIETLYGETTRVEDAALTSGASLRTDVPGELFDVRVVLEPGAADGVELRVGGEPIRCDVAGGQLTCREQSAELPLIDGRVALRVLADRTSIEIFAADGAASMTHFCVPDPAKPMLELAAVGGEAHIVSLAATELRSIWA
jgi:sucrose-6-phosphate hydrolase SacC (GH32 family)